ncbi:tetratricopeptide repeat protein [Streptosporangiaceae bacterium NEAU-GS5]|nr:tetratricopeptide repeat protein [Streptosporangiaceae bacterium NEAU-GS5]
MLAALAADAHRTVTVETLIDRVWDEAPPGARRTLHVLITRLRRVLREGDRALVPIVHRSGGYALDIDPEQVDLHRFRDLAARARETGLGDQARVELLRQVRELWRGDALTGLPGEWPAQMRQSWRQDYVDALVAWARAELRVGNPAMAGPLTELTQAYPLVEPLAAALMRTLAAAGRVGEALKFFESVRHRLADELGADPGAELRDLHQAILRGEVEPAPSAPPPATTGPAQLPAEVSAFTGRQAELDGLDGFLAESVAYGEPAPTMIAVLSGTAGVGKSALAVRWAHRERSRFPDGQLHVNLRGYDPERPLSAGQALARFLAALGVAGHEIPLDTDDRAALWRTQVADRRMLILLDNAASVEQVRPLLPGSPRSAVLVTSRDSLAGLVAVHGARRLELGLLPLPDALALLGRLIGPRLDAEPGPAAALAEQCARLPLALRIAAELAAARPTTPLADLVAELADHQRRLELLDAGGDPRAAVQAVFSWSIRHLPPAAVRTFGLLGLHPGPDIDVFAAAALAGDNPARTGRALAELARAHLVQPTANGRYGMHDLLRAYAASLASTAERTDDTRAALGRLFDYYLAVAAAATDTLYPADARTRPNVPAPPGAVPDMTDPAAARDWLGAERPCLVAMAGHTAEHGWYDHAIRLSTTLLRHLDNGHFTDALIIHGRARDAAAKIGDRAAQGRATLDLGAVHALLGDYGLAAEHHKRALDLFRQAGDLPGEARAVANLGVAEERLGRYQAAAGHLRQALALFRSSGDEVGEARVLTSLATVEVGLGRDQAAAEHYTRALALFVKAGDQGGEAQVLNFISLVEERLGRSEAATEHLQRGLELSRQVGDRLSEAAALDNLGTLHLRLGDPRQAAEHYAAALSIFREIGARDGEAWALNGLGEAAYATGQAADALAHHAQALALAEELAVPDQHARAHAGLARAHRALGQLPQAGEHHTQAAVLYAELGVQYRD